MSCIPWARTRCPQADLLMSDGGLREDEYGQLGVFLGVEVSPEGDVRQLQILSERRDGHTHTH